MRTRRRTYTAATPAWLLPEALIVQALAVSGTKRRNLQSCSAKAKGNRGSKCITGLWDLNIPSELLQEILSRLGLKANIQVSAVCKAWCEAAVCVRKLQRRPWLFYPIDPLDLTGKLYILVDPLRSQSQTYKVDFPVLKDHAISYSRDGWVLVRSHQHYRALFLNPFTDKRFYLPNVSSYYHDRYCLAFSAAPTSTSCVVISYSQVITEGDVVIDTWRPGESAWTTHRFDKCKIFGRWDRCVFANGMFYCLSTCGHLGVFDPCEATWNLLPVKPCPAFYPLCYRTPVLMTEHEGDIFVIYTHNDNSNPTVFKLNLKQSVWEEKRDLGGLTVFASCPTSFIRAGLSPEERNRIYTSFIHIHGTYYSLGDGKSSNPPPIPYMSCRVAWVNNVNLL